MAINQFLNFILIENKLCTRQDFSLASKKEEEEKEEEEEEEEEEEKEKEEIFS